MSNPKFRAWDKVAKKYLKPWPEGFGILGEATCFDLIGQQLKERSPEKTVLEMLDDVEIEQYTGIKDCVGNKIWQHSICTAEYRCAVCFDSEPHLLTGLIEQEDNGLWMLEYEHGSLPLDCEDLQLITVVGNFYDNPELLEAK